MKCITKLNKTTGEKVLVTVEEFLSFVNGGPKKREEALVSLIEGSLIQNLDVAYFIEPIRDHVGDRS